MQYITPLMPAYPELFLLGMVCVILVADLFVSDDNRVITYALTQLALAGCIAITRINCTAPANRLHPSRRFGCRPKANTIKPPAAATATANNGTIDTTGSISLMMVRYPCRLSRSSAWIVRKLRNSAIRMARPMAASAAATVRMKKTKICPAGSPR